MIGTVIDGKYRLDSRLATGAAGEVYLATQLNLQRSVALKLMRGGAGAAHDSIERFRREALAVARLKHPNIVTVFDFGAAPDLGVYLVMEFVEGETLAERIGRLGRLPTEQAVEIVRQVCSAVSCAHAAGILHRDLKPGNIVVEEAADAFHVKVLDFGVAKLFGLDPAAAQITADGELVGTPLYMAPELCKGEPPDVRSDVYAIGCVLFETLTGRPPFRARSITAVLVAHLDAVPPAPSSIEPAVPNPDYS